MATIKSYTDLEQSKKLAEILLFESADNTYERIAIAGCNLGIPEERQYVHRDIPFTFFSGIGVPCWSLAALLGVLPMITKGKDTANPFITKTPDYKYYVVYATLTKEVDSSDIYDNPIDACYEMILRLHELNLL